MLLQPYLFFDGCAEKAVLFYRDALGAELEMLMRFKDSPEPLPPDCAPDTWGDKVMHASLKIGELRLMISDGMGEAIKHGGYSLSLSVPTAADVDHVIAALAADGGEITMPADTTFWSPRFGMLRDRFGVSWMVGIDSAPGC
jgi:PhnB protein